jgi:hypothetical protein
MELAACHLSGALNFEIVPRFLENLYTHNLRFCVSSEYFGPHVNVAYFEFGLGDTPYGRNAFGLVWFFM